MHRRGVLRRIVWDGWSSGGMMKANESYCSINFYKLNPTINLLTGAYYSLDTSCYWVCITHHNVWKGLIVMQPTKFQTPIIISIRQLTLTDPQLQFLQHIHEAIDTQKFKIRPGPVYIIPGVIFKPGSTWGPAQLRLIHRLTPN